MTPRLISAGLALLVTAFQVALALWALGVPEPGAAAAFLAGSVPTTGQAVAILELVLWGALLVTAVAAVGTVMREARRLVPGPTVRRGWCVAVVLCGATILLAGAAHQLAPPSLGLDGGGSVSQATRALGP